MFMRNTDTSCIAVPGTIYDDPIIGVVLIYKKVSGGRAEFKTHGAGGSSSDSGEGGGGNRKARGDPPGAVEEVEGAR